MHLQPIQARVQYSGFRRLDMDSLMVTAHISVVSRCQTVDTDIYTTWDLNKQATVDRFLSIEVKTSRLR